METCGFIPVAVAVTVDPLRALVGEGIVDVGVAVAVRISAPQPSHFRRGSKQHGTGVRVVSTRVVAVAIAVTVGPLRGVRSKGVGAVGDGPSAVRVGIPVAVAVCTAVSVLVRGTVHRRTAVPGGGRRRIVAVAIAVAVGPLGVVGRVGVGTVGGAPGPVGVGVAVPVLVSTSVAVLGRGARNTVAGVGSVGCGPRTVGVGVAVSVGVEATKSVAGGVASCGRARIGFEARRVVAVAVEIRVGPLGWNAREGVGAVVDGPRTVGVGIAVSVGVGAARSVGG